MKFYHVPVEIMVEAPTAEAALAALTSTLEGMLHARESDSTPGVFGFTHPRLAEVREITSFDN